jgi:hypothetical protein
MTYILHPSFGRDPLVRYCKVSEKVFRNSNVFHSFTDLTTGSGQDYHFFLKIVTGSEMLQYKIRFRSERQV